MAHFDDNEKITTDLGHGAAVHVYNHGPVTLTSLAGGHIALTEEAADRLLTTLLARKAAKEESDRGGDVFTGLRGNHPLADK